MKNNKYRMTACVLAVLVWNAASVQTSSSNAGVSTRGSSSPEEARAQLIADMERYRKLVKAIGLKLQQ